jgi:hypothetical protein
VSEVPSFQWAVLSDIDERVRYDVISAELNKIGFQNSFSFVLCPAPEITVAVNEAQKKYSAIRIGGGLRNLVADFSPMLPSMMFALKSADALVIENGSWSPRNFLLEGLQQTFAQAVASFDLHGSVFIIGATPEAKAVVAAVSRIGYKSVLLTDSDESRAKELLHSLKGGFFGLEIEFISPSQVTQLPGASMVAVNTLAAGADGGLLGELFYFNFLHAGGVWLDLALFPQNPHLQVEAETVGAIVADGVGVWARTDWIWARHCLALLNSPLYDKLLLESVTESLQRACAESFAPSVNET